MDIQGYSIEFPHLGIQKLEGRGLSLNARCNDERRSVADRFTARITRVNFETQNRHEVIEKNASFFFNPKKHEK